MIRRPAFPVGVASVVLCATGCAQLAGIEATSGKDRPTDSLSIQRVSIGARVVTAPLDLTGLTATFLPDGAAPIAATTTAPGVWQSNLFDPAPVEFTLPDPVTPTQPAFPRLFALGTAASGATFNQLEHPAPAPAPTPASLTFNVPLDTPTTGNEGLEFYVVGAWAVRGFAAAEVPVGSAAIATTIDYATSANLASQPQLTKITPDDALVVLRYAGPTLTGVSEATPFAQTGADTVVTPAMTAVAADQTFSASLDPTHLSARFSTVKPAMTGLTMSWGISAAPGGMYGANAGPQLNAGAVAVTDTTITATYGNPFTAHAWPPLLTFIANETRAFTPAGQTLGASLLAQMAQLTAPATGVTLDVQAGLANNVQINGTLLTVDGVAITKPTAPAQVTFQTDDGQADLYDVQLLDLVPNAGNTALVPRIVIAEFGRQPPFQIPAELFQAGHNYTVRVIASVGGFPKAAAGDLQTRTLPLAQSLVDSAVFTVMP
ncbi:MAG TPA: hypothetical protein VFP84_22745 [Kofleriaceae bacterium]|nr:hypothetical protein [Kofleriaceae bacterium]